MLDKSTDHKKEPVSHNTDQDSAYMQYALELSEQGLGRTAPNPCVGCVIVKDGSIVGMARSADGGRPHAEAIALEQAGKAARGADIYVSLEPCGHHGKTPPCVESIIRAKPARVIIATLDPNQTKHDCLNRLRDAGIKVICGVCEDKANELHEGFFKTVLKAKPLVTAKIATSLDGKIATHSGHSKWITSQASRQLVHEYRAKYDAVLAGVGTVLADDPMLNVRLKDHDFQPIRIIIDPQLKTPLKSKLIRSARDENVWLISALQKGCEKEQSFTDENVNVIAMPETLSNGVFDINVLLNKLASKGITRLFVEGGGKTLSAFLAAGAVDNLLWFRAPILIGNDGISAFQALGVEQLDEALKMELMDQRAIEQDLLEIWRIKR